MKVWESPEGVDGPKNKKGRPFGSGTTTQKKRELRAHKQWSYNPTSPECLVKHLEALEKAKEKCQAKLNEKLQDAIDGVASDGTVSSSRAEKKSLEKDSSAPQQKKQKTKTPGPEVLGKGQPRGFGKVLCQGGQAGQARGKEKLSSPLPLVLQKRFGKVQGFGISSAAADKPLVVVDWHNTLEVGEDASGRNAYAFTLLGGHIELCGVQEEGGGGPQPNKELAPMDTGQAHGLHGLLAKMWCRWQDTHSHRPGSSGNFRLQRNLTRSTGVGIADLPHSDQVGEAQMASRPTEGVSLILCG